MSGWDLSGELFALIDSLGELRVLATRDVRADGEIPLVREALELLVRQHGLEQCSVFMNFDDRLCCIAGRGSTDGPSQSPAPPGAVFRTGVGLMGYAASSGRLQHAPDLRLDTRYVRSPEQEVSGSLICAPMVSRRRVLGVVNAYSTQTGHFEPWHEGVFTLFASALAHILDNNRVLRRLAEARMASGVAA